MAHEVETMFSARELPWHGLGKVTPDVLTAKEAIIEAGLDWEVELRTLFVSLPGGNRKKIEDRKAVMRNSDNAVLGIVSPLYVPFQNRDAFAFTDNLVDSGDAKYETAGSLRDGRVVFLTMKVPFGMNVDGDDAHDLYIVLRTSHDGSTAISVAVTPIRVVCMNTMTMALRRARHKWSMRHVSTLEGRLQEARDTLALTHSYADAFVGRANEMVAHKITDDAFHSLLEDLLPQRPKTEETIDTIMDFYRNSPTNGYTGTAWGGINAITEYFEHGRDLKVSEARMGNTIDGHIAQLRSKAGNMLLAL